MEQVSGIENVEQYDTVIFFCESQTIASYIKLSNVTSNIISASTIFIDLQVESLSSSDVNISVSPDICCVFVEEKDIICGQVFPSALNIICLVVLIR